MLRRGRGVGGTRGETKQGGAGGGRCHLAIGLVLSGEAVRALRASRAPWRAEGGSEAGERREDMGWQECADLMLRAGPGARRHAVSGCVSRIHPRAQEARTRQDSDSDERRPMCRQEGMQS